jgi:hypothetical protein
MEEEDEKGSKRKQANVGGAGGSSREQEGRSRRDEEGSRWMWEGPERQEGEAGSRGKL